MNTLSIFNPAFASGVFDVFDREFGYAAATAKPLVDIRETAESYVMDMDLPGYSDKDVDVSLKDRVLTVSSVTTEEKEDKGEYLIRERRESSFVRRFSLPKDIDAERVEAAFRNGVLTVTIPRIPESQPRQILVKSA